MRRFLGKLRKQEDGMLIVEATYVFPIMLLVILLLIYAGNAFLLKCKIESIVSQEILKCAAYCGDPVTFYIEEDGGIPEYGEINVLPYRFILGGLNGVNGITSHIEDSINNEINSVGGGFFKNMKPDIETVNVNFNNAFIYSKVSADVEYDITLPIRMLGSEEPIIMEFTARVDVPVSDSVELIRNIDMIEDYLQRSDSYLTFQGKIGEVTHKMKDLLGLGG